MIESGKLESWLKKVKATSLRHWLNLREMKELILAQKTPTVYLVVQSAAGLQCLTIRIDEIADKDVELSEMVFNCTLVLDDGKDKKLQVKASGFVADPDRELAHLSRMFASAIRRDHFIEDALFLVDIANEDYREGQKRAANNFFKRFGGSNDGATPA
jgi:hypothetical protein